MVTLDIDTIIARCDPNALGEMLRDITFVGEGYGCYSDFDLLPEAVKLSKADREIFWRASKYEDPEEVAGMGEGCIYSIGDYRIEMVYYWDGDGVLAFRVYKGLQILAHIENDDCKKNYRWEHVQCQFVERTSKRLYAEASLWLLVGQ